MTQKGFSLVELLAVIVILGVLSGVAMNAYSRYKTSAIKKGINTLIKSSYSAAENYFFDNSGANSVTVEYLVDHGYLENRSDPYKPSRQCTGTVTKTTSTSSKEGVLNLYSFQVTITCSGNTFCKKFPEETTC